MFLKEEEGFEKNKLCSRLKDPHIPTGLNLEWMLMVPRGWILVASVFSCCTRFKVWVRKWKCLHNFIYLIIHYIPSPGSGLTFTQINFPDGKSILIFQWNINTPSLRFVQLHTEIDVKCRDVESGVELSHCVGGCWETGSSFTRLIWVTSQPLFYCIRRRFHGDGGSHQPLSASSSSSVLDTHVWWLPVFFLFIYLLVSWHFSDSASRLGTTR